jgi:GNAT superfamily N-acetyltransferase
MSGIRAEYELRPPRSQEEWCAYHAIRQRAIFAVYRPDIVYDPNYPDEYKPNHLSNAQFWRGNIIGTIRIDVVGAARVVFRFVAVEPELQGRGHGTVLLALAEECRL